MQNIISKASTSQLLEAERLAIKYNPALALAIAKEYYKRTTQ
jgi:hypothetical protein